VHPRGNFGGCYPGELVQAAFAWRGRLISYAVLNTYLVCLPFQTCVLAADEVLDDLELEEVESPLSALVKLQCRLQCKHDCRHDDGRWRHRWTHAVPDGH
jgi:hypothetical protein